MSSLRLGALSYTNLYSFLIFIDWLILLKIFKNVIDLRGGGGGERAGERDRENQRERDRDRARHCFVVPLTCALTGIEPATMAHLTN